MKAIWKGVLYAIVVNLIIVSVPITVSLLQIVQSPQPDLESPFYHFAARLRCYSVLGCSRGLAYVFFSLEWVIFTLVVYRMLLRRTSMVSERKKILLGFIVAFPFASYVMSKFMLFTVAFADILKFGFV